MFLLLPEEQKKKLFGFYRMRLVFVCFLAFTILTGYGFFSMLPAYFVAYSEEGSIEFLKNSVDKSILSKSDEDLKKTLLNIKQNISALQGEDKDLVLIIGEVVEKKPIALSIQKISYKNNESEPSVLIISGISNDRPSLIQFSKNLQLNPKFAKVDLPISNLAKDTNIDFNIVISGNF